LIGALIVAFLAADVLFLSRLMRYRNETVRLREGMTESQRERADLVVEAERHRFRVEMELIRRQARGNRELHLAVNVDSAQMILERDGVILRQMHVQLTPSSIPGAASDSDIVVRTLGERSIARVLRRGDPIPESVWTARDLPVPDQRSGVLGDRAILLDDGTVVYGLPDESADSSGALPRSVRIAAADLEALAANIRPGMSIYFYR
jgi:hypothetical protein